MASLRVAMDAAFWDLDLATPQASDGVARCVPGEPAPLGLARASRTIRPQQLSFLSNAFPLGIIPSLTPASEKELGSFSVESFLSGPSSANWWTGLVWQFRPRKLIAGIKGEIAGGDEIELPAFKDIAKHFLDKSLYAVGLFSQFSLTADTSLLLNFEKHGSRKEHRSKAMLVHKLPEHDITIQAAWPELFVDSNGKYWDVPSSVSLDLASLVSDSGFRYRFGLHKNDGYAKARHSTSDEIPLSLMPGVFAKAAFSYEKSRDFWRDKEKKSTRARRVDNEASRLSSYDVRLQEPHSTISGIVGGTCVACFGEYDNSSARLKIETGVGKINSNVGSSTKTRSHFSADLFGSLCYTLQHGKFKKDFNDLTRIDIRLDVSSATSIIKGIEHLVSGKSGGQDGGKVNPLASPRLNMILQQQVAGPIVFRVDSRVSTSSPSGKVIPYVEDVMYGLSYSLRLLQSGKILAWYSPKRQEAMVELRFYEF